ncbi:unnamed protein product [Schistosoma mattheei]|uniref:Uncharacterized protein n=1 Tax=Schistosoma mattheei TaxID=31246 RepID=A0A183PMA1_9TREM|nr:unnamed protein product [Schistosoma mattheei]
MLSKRAQSALIGWESHGPRIIKASFKTKKEGMTMNIIQCHAPTNDYDGDAKDQFYNRLQSIIEKCPTKDLVTLMGDFNAKIQERRNKKAAINTSRTRAEKVKAQSEYTEVNKQAKRCIRIDKRKYVEDLATTAEKAAREGNMRGLYDITKKLSGNHCKPERPVKSKVGKIITNI